MRILISGASGFIGSHLADALTAQGHTVIGTGHVGGENSMTCINAGYSLTKLDWNKIGHIDILCHQAACTDTTITYADFMTRVNLHASQTLFRQAVAHGCKKIVYASSCAVYGNCPTPFREDGCVNPLNPYATSKLLLDGWAGAFAHEHNVTLVGLRYSNVFGRGERHKDKAASMVSRLYWQMEEGNPQLFRDGTQRRDWVYIKDVVQANLLAMNSTKSGIFNIGSAHSTSFNKLVEIWNQVTGWDRTPQYIDNPYADQYQSITEVDITKAAKELGYKPRWSIEDAIADYYQEEMLAESRLRSV